MNNLLKLTAFLCLIVTVNSCTVEPLEDTFTAKSTENLINSAAIAQTCSGQNPQSRLVNNGSIPFTFVVIDSNDNTAQIQSIAPGTTSTFITFSEGQTLFAVESNVSGISDSKVLLDMTTCTEVDIVINAGNTLDTPTIVVMD